MSKNRTQYTPKQKTAIAVAAIAEKRTQAQLSSDYKVHASQIKQWKQQALTAIENDFMGHHAKQAKSHDKLVGDLYQQIGQLHTQVDWLKKKSELNKRGEA